MNIRSTAIFALAILTTTSAAIDTRAAEERNTLRVFYFGNSLTGSAMPALHEELGKSAEKEKPDLLDFAIYNDPEKYGPDIHHDRGKVIPITPERARVLHETIWEVLKSHPHASGAN
jgi:hypothetical protein